MRILLAFDGSACAETARDLVSHLPWPDPSHVDALRVIEPVFDLFVMPPMELEDSVDEFLGVAEVRASLDAEVSALARPGLIVETHVVVGRAASLIVETAQELGSNLVVMGSRGRGPIGSMVLGSVSAEVAGHAPCPVLVARASTCARTILALDGTPAADRIVEAVSGWPFLAETHLEVVSVAPSAVPGPGVMLSGAYGMPIAWYEEAAESARAALEEAASAAVRRLRAGDLDAGWSIYEGDPAAVLIDVAERTNADLVILGTHGLSGMSRLLMGSVARNVLLHTSASVLIVRDEQVGSPPEPSS